MPKRKFHQLDQIVQQELAIQAQEARQDGSLWYYTQVMCQVALPARPVKGSEYYRNSGQFHLSVTTPSVIGVPWGIFPRGVLNWLVTEIKLRRNDTELAKTRKIPVGDSLAEFFYKISGTQSVSGGETGNITRYKAHLKSLFFSTIIYWADYNRTEASPARTDFRTLRVADEGSLLWHPKIFDQRGLFASHIDVTEGFWNDCMEHGVPVDVRIIRALWPDCMAFDAYVWLTYRAFQNQWLSISWPSLKIQFGHQYKNELDFRSRFREALRKVAYLYKDMSFKERPEKGSQPAGLTIQLKRPSIVPMGGIPVHGERKAQLEFPGWHRRKSLNLLKESTHKESDNTPDKKS